MPAWPRGWSQTRLVYELQRRARTRASTAPTRESLKTQISRWENGHKVPDEMYRRLFREIYGLSDHELGFPRSRGSQPPSTDQPGVGGVLLAPLPAMPFADGDYLEAVRRHIWHIVELDNQYGGTDLASLAIRFFRSLHHQLGIGAYRPTIERDLQAVVGELAEVAGWLLYDADRQTDVRRMNQEALYFSRLAGDRQMELLTLQNSSMHAGFLGRPLEALHLAESVLQGRDRLTPRVKALFLVRKARALAQGGDDQAMQLFDAVRSHFQDGGCDSDPKWAWWVDERELAWHEGMAQLHLGRPTVAAELFERSVASTKPHEVRSRYLHLAYLLGAQTRISAWRDAEESLRQLTPLANEVASQRTAVLLSKSLPRLCEPHVPTGTREAAEQLQQVLG